MMGSQKLRSPEPLRGRGAPVAALLMALAGSCGGGTAATDGGDAAGGIGGRGGSAAGGGIGGASGSNGGGAGGASGSNGGGGGGGATGGDGGSGGSIGGHDGGGSGGATAGGSGGSAGGGGSGGAGVDGGAADTAGDATGDAGPDGNDAGCGPRPNTTCVPGAPDNCSTDVSWALICSGGTWKCPLASIPADTCICWDPGPGFERQCVDGGVPEQCAEGPIPSPVCGAQCGNGTRDSCRYKRGPQSSCPEYPGTEDCDGQDFGGETCRSQGYASGNLTCSAACAIDTATCVECAALSAPVARCGGAPVGAKYLGDLALAATDTEVAIAWTDADDPTGVRVSFTRLTPALAATGTTVLEMSRVQAGVVVAPLPSGWVVGVGGDDGLNGTDVSFYTIAPDGRAIDHITLESGLVADDGWWNPMMAARSGGGPLLVWQTGNAVRASVISDDGRSATTPVSIPIDPDDFITDAAYVGGAFYVTSLAETDSQNDAPYKLSIARIETDGRATTVVEALPGQVSDFASLVAGAPDLRIVYTGFAPPYGEHRTYWRRLDASGAAASPAVELERDPYGFGIGSRAVTLGDEAVVMLDESNVQLRLARVTSAGVITTPAQDLATAPGLYSVAVARRGPEVVLGWLSPLGIGLARIAP